MKNEEIKEIIRKDYEDNFRKEFVDIILELPFSNLLDYITNLQQEIEEYQKDYERLYIEDCKLRENHNIDDISLLDENYKLQQDLDKANEIIEKDRKFYKCRMDEYAELKKENERLKENNQSYQEEMIRTWKIADDYKTRIDKVTEYIKDKNNLILNQDRRKLMNILKGSDENE